MTEVEEGSHLSTLMVSSEEHKSIGEVDFERQQQQHTLNRERTSINVIPQEQVFGILGVSAHIQQFE